MRELKLKRLLFLAAFLLLFTAEGRYQAQWSQVKRMSAETADGPQFTVWTDRQVINFAKTSSSGTKLATPVRARPTS